MTVTYRTKIVQTGRNTGIPVPDDVLEQLGAGRRPAVTADVDGYTLRATVGSMGGTAMLAFSAAHRQASGLGGGDDVTVALSVDAAPQEADVPDDLATAIAAAPDVARRTWEQLAPSYRRNFVDQIEAAKQQETRDRRIAATIAKLEAGQKR